MSKNAENPEGAEKSLEIPETAAPPLEKLVAGEADPGNPETREQIEDPDFPAEKSGENPGEEKNWAEVAKGKRPRGRPRKNPVEEISPEKRAEIDAMKAEKERFELEQKIRANKASGIVTMAEFGLLYFARRFGVPEKEIELRAKEKAELQKAIEPLVSAEAEDPWSNLLMVTIAVGGPRVAVLAKARAEQQAAEAEAVEDASHREDREEGTSWASAAA